MFILPAEQTKVTPWAQRELKTNPSGVQYRDNWYIIPDNPEGKDFIEMYGTPYGWKVGDTVNLPMYGGGQQDSQYKGAATAEEAKAANLILPEANPSLVPAGLKDEYDLDGNFVGSGREKWVGELQGSSGVIPPEQYQQSKNSFLEKTLGKYIHDPLVSAGESIVDVGKQGLEWADEHANELATAAAIATAIAATAGTAMYAAGPATAGAGAGAGALEAGAGLEGLGSLLAGEATGPLLSGGAGGLELAGTGGLLAGEAAGPLLSGGGLLTAGAVGGGLGLPSLGTVAAGASLANTAADALSGGSGMIEDTWAGGDFSGVPNLDDSGITDVVKTAWDSLKASGGDVLSWIAKHPAEALTLGLTAAGGVINYDAARAAANTLADATNAATEAQLKMFEQGRADTAPWREAGGRALNTLEAKLAEGPGEFTESPGYQFRLAEAQKAIERSAAAKGALGTGSTLKAIERFGQDYASNEYQNYLANYYQSLNPYQSLAGLGQTTAMGTAAQGNLVAGQVGQNTIAGGAAQGGGKINQANTLTGAIGSGLNNYLAFRYLDQAKNKPYIYLGG